jgi:hypothetical protein
MLTANGKGALGGHALEFGFYALLQVLACAALLAILRHADSYGLAPAALARANERATRVTYGIMLGFGVSIPFFFATRFAWLLWLVVPFLATGFHRRRGNTQ